MKCGYARVSTDDQSTALRFAALKRAGCKTLFKDEGLSGATTKRPALLQPADLYMSLGAHGNSSVIIPSLRLVLVCARGKWGSHEPGDPASPMNTLLKTLAEAAGWRRGPARIPGGVNAPRQY